MYTNNSRELTVCPSWSAASPVGVASGAASMFSLVVVGASWETALVASVAVGSFRSSGFVDAVASTGVGGALSFASFGRLASLFFSSVRRKTLIVVRRALCGLQSSKESGECSHTGQEDGRRAWPMAVSKGIKTLRVNVTAGLTLTVFAYCLVATWKPDRVHGELAADSTTKLDGDFRNRATSRDVSIHERSVSLTCRDTM